MRNTEFIIHVFETISPVRTRAKLLDPYFLPNTAKFETISVLNIHVFETISPVQTCAKLLNSGPNTVQTRG